jgi:20S proteasome alpha/beta subunit
VSGGSARELGERLADPATRVSVRSRLKFKLNMYTMTEEREIKPKTLSALISTMMYEKRFGPWFVEPVIAGLTEDNQPFLSSMDCLGCEMMTKDFVVAGTMEEALYGMCESLYKPDLVRRRRVAAWPPACGLLTRSRVCV